MVAARMVTYRLAIYHGRRFGLPEARGGGGANGRLGQMPGYEQGSLRFQDASHGGGELLPFLFAKAQFGQTFGGDGEDAAFVVFAGLDDSGRDQAALFHRGEQGIQTAERESKIMAGSGCQRLAELVAVLRLAGQQRQHQRLGVPV